MLVSECQAIRHGDEAISYAPKRLAIEQQARLSRRNTRHHARERHAECRTAETLKESAPIHAAAPSAGGCKAACAVAMSTAFPCAWSACAIAA